MNYVLKLILKVDMRTKSFDVPPQEILTKDSVTVTVDAVIYYKVRDANGKSYHTGLVSQNMPCRNRTDSCSDRLIELTDKSSKASVQNIKDVHSSTRMLAQTTLRNILGTRTLSGILSEREQVSSEVLLILDNATDPWGIAVERNRDLIRQSHWKC